MALVGRVGRGHAGACPGDTTPRPRVREELAHRNWKRSFRSCSSIAEMEKSPWPKVPECPGLGGGSHWRNWALAQAPSQQSLALGGELGQALQPPAAVGRAWVWG